MRRGQARSAAARRPRAAVRPARREDAAAIARMANRLNVLMGEADGMFTPAIVRRDLFGRRPAVEALTVVAAGEVIGYAFFLRSYDTDLAAPGLFLVDMFVEASWRRCGVGRELMTALARIARRRGAKSLSWAVLTRNRPARAFYRRLGARDEGARVNELYGKALERLAESRRQR